jgi:23S rRNA (uracil1939-C5)-methyltransferase
MGHADGRTVFVPLSAPGDRLRVSIDKERGSVVWAVIKEVLQSSPDRQEPPCPYFGRCGGCDFQQLNYPVQLRAKAEIIRDCLRRIAKIDLPAEIEVVAAPDSWAYRSRAQWQLDKQHLRLGYFERGTHNVIDVVHCPVLVPSLQSSLTQVREHMNAGNLTQGATEFQAVSGDEGASVVPPINGNQSFVTSRRVGEFNFEFSADGFFQINQTMLEALVFEATQGLHGSAAVDLYCGVGLFTLPLAKRFGRVIGVEGNPAAVEWGRSNLQKAGLKNASIERSAVADWLRSSGIEPGSIDLLLLDPPRTGVGEGSVDQIIEIRPRRISYVSCDPATLARDIKPLVQAGYEIESIKGFDMFPQTHHVETVVHLKSGNTQ